MPLDIVEDVAFTVPSGPGNTVETTPDGRCVEVTLV